LGYSQNENGSLPFEEVEEVVDLRIVAVVYSLMRLRRTKRRRAEVDEEDGSSQLFERFTPV